MEGMFAFPGRPYVNENVTVTLPAGTDVCDIGTLTIWCRQFTAIFTRLELSPAELFVRILNAL